jgi:mRNA interferase RelE/StbE
MSYQINFLPEALNDMKRLDNSIRPKVVKGIQKVSQNPVSIYQGGYGKPLGNKDGADLTGLLKLNFVEAESVLFTL